MWFLLFTSLLILAIAVIFCCIITADIAEEDMRNMKFCPDCDTPLDPDGGCFYCRNCGWSCCG